MLAIALLYFLLRATTGLSPLQAAGAAIAAGFLVEGLQYIHLAERLNLRQGSPLYIALGNTFSPADLLMYGLGGLLALAADLYLFLPAVVRLHKGSGRAEENKGLKSQND